MLKGITTKKRKGRGKKKKRDTGQEETPEILSAFPPLDFCTCLYFRSEHSSGDGPVSPGDKFSKVFGLQVGKLLKAPKIFQVNIHFEIPVHTISTQKRKKATSSTLIQKHVIFKTFPHRLKFDDI